MTSDSSDAADGSRMLPLTRAYEWLLRIGFALTPLIAIAYLHFFGNPALRFIDYPFHEAVIAVAISISAFVSYVTWRCYRHSGEPFLFWVAQGLTGFTLVYLPHGVLTRTADCNLWLFLLYGPVSRVVMVASLLIALLRYGAPVDSPERRRQTLPIWLGVAVFAVIDLAVGAVASAPATYSPAVRMFAENATIGIAILCVAIMAGRRIDSPLMQLYLLGMAFFAESSLAFLLAKPWDHQWWLGHVVFAGGFFILSYGIVQAFQTTRAFATVYSQAEMMRQLEHANAELARLAATDALTGTANRRHFFERVAEEMARAKRMGTPLALLTMDIDRFKKVNDTYGHQAGDAVLVAFASRVRETLRPTDILGRLGGEEFSVLLPDCATEQAAEIAERIRAGTEQDPIAVPKAALHVTVSIGIAEFGRDGERLEEVARIADDRLYRAKSGGRNRVVSA